MELATIDRTMSSFEISKLVEARHDSVKRTVERLAERSVIRLPPMVEVENQSNQALKVYLLNRRSSIIVVAQLCPEFTGRIVDRWQELEDQASSPELSSDIVETLVAQQAHILDILIEQNVRLQQPKKRKPRRDIEPPELTIQPPDDGSYIEVGNFLKRLTYFDFGRGFERMERLAAQYCLDRDIPCQRMPRKEYGNLWRYPVETLEKIFGED